MTFIEIAGNRKAWVNTDAIASIEEGPEHHGAIVALAGGDHYHVTDGADAARIAVIEAANGGKSILLRDESVEAAPVE